MIVTRIAVGQVPAHGGEIAHDRVGDDLGGIDEDRIALLHDLGTLQRRFARAPSDAQHPALFLDVLEARDLADVDEVTGLTQAELEERQQALATREDLCVLGIFPEKRNRLRERGWCVVVEAGRDHGFPSLSLVSGRTRR